MAHNHRMQGIADPYLTRRLSAIYRQSTDVRNEARGPRDMAQQVRGYMDMSSGDSPGLEGRSNMQDDYDDSEERDNFTDADLMPGANAPIDAGIRAFQESGHGVTVFKPMRRDYKVYKEDEEN